MCLNFTYKLSFHLVTLTILLPHAAEKDGIPIEEPVIPLCLLVHLYIVMFKYRECDHIHFTKQEMS